MTSEKPTPDLPVSARTSRLSATSMNRELPPVPSGHSKPPTLKLDVRNLTATALASLPAPPTTPSSVRSAFLSPTRLDSPTRTPSPSIRNLDQRSMVKQRLAQIEGASSRPQSPVSPSKFRQGNDSPLSLRRQATEGSSVSTSIVNSYLGSDVGSPMSDRSGRLTSCLGSPPPRPSAFNGRNGGSRFLGPPMVDSAPVSPVSNYSAESERTAAPALQTGCAVQPLTVPSPTSSSVIMRPVEVQPVLPPDEMVQPSLLEDIRLGMQSLQGRSATAATNIVSIRTKVDEVLEELRQRPEAGHDGDAPTPAVLEKLEALQTDIKGHLLELQNAVEGLKGSGGNLPVRQATGLPDLAALHEKLDHLVQRGQAGTGGGQEGQITSTDVCRTYSVSPRSTDVLLRSWLKSWRSSEMQKSSVSVS